jgi:hypothetical protein
MKNVWEKLDPSVGVLDLDLNAVNIHNVKHRGTKFELRVEKGMLPEPYQGHVDSAKVIFLMLNPCFDETDKKFYANKEYYDEVLDTINQDLDKEYQFSILHPKWSTSPASRYWRRQMGKYAEAISSIKGISFEAGMKVVANNIATVELFPYHSKNWTSTKSLMQIQSVKYSRYLAKKAIIDTNKIVVCTRAIREWSMGNCDLTKFDASLLPTKRSKQSPSLGPGNVNEFDKIVEHIINQ